MRAIRAAAALLALGACTSRPDDTPRGDSARHVTRAAPSTPTTLPVSVRVGGQEEEVDACSLGGLRAGAGGTRRFVMVRSGPGATYPVVDSIVSPYRFYSCDGKNDWVGIVYHKQGDPEDPSGNCGGLTSRISRQRAYAGPCRSGWIPSMVQEILAG